MKKEYNTYTTDGDKTGTLSIGIQEKQKCNLIFYNDKGEHIGEMDFSDGIFRFTGNADESAKVFVKWVKEYFKL